MKKTIIAVFVFLAFSSTASASQLIKQLFSYECHQANRDDLPFTCDVIVFDGIPYLTFTYADMTDDKGVLYRQALLMHRFFEGGGVFVDIINEKIRKKRTCSRIRGRFDVSCESWRPAE